MINAAFSSVGEAAYTRRIVSTDDRQYVPKDDPSHRQAFLVLFAVFMISNAGNTALQSVLPAIGREIGIRDTLIAGVFSLSALAWTIASPIWARKSDTWGRKRVIVIGLAGFTLSMLLFGAAVLIGLWRLVPPLAVFACMLVGRSLYGLVGSASSPAVQAYVADRTPREERTAAMATLASAAGLGTVVGPVISPFLTLPVIGLAGPLLVFTLLGVAATVLVARKLPSGDAPRDLYASRPTVAGPPPKGLWRDKRVAPLLIYGFVLASAQAINVQTLGFAVIDKLKATPSEAQTFIGLAMFAGALVTVGAQWGPIRMLRMTPRDLLRWGALFAVGGNVVLAMADTYYGLVVGYALASLGYGFARPGFTAGASLAVGPGEQGAIAGVVAALNGACYIAAPIIGVGLYEAYGPAPFLLSAVCLGGLLVVSFYNPVLRSSGYDPEREDPTDAPTPP
jgi:MFS family permease